MQNDKVDASVSLFSLPTTAIAAVSHQPSSIVFPGEGNTEIMRLNPNGDIFVNGNLAENDKEVVDALRNFLSKGRY